MIPYLWSCQPQSIYVDHTLPYQVMEAVQQWHDLYRPDWTFTSAITGATVTIRPYDFSSTPYGGYTDLKKDNGVIRGADVLIGSNIDSDYAGDIARHEMEHVSGFEHSDDVPAMQAIGKYSFKDWVWLTFFGRKCVG